MTMRPIAAIAAILAAACGTEDAPDPLEPDGPTGRVRFVNVITDTTRGRVNAILEGVPFGVNLTYTLSTPATLPAPSTAPYAPILTGSRTLVLRRTADTTALVATLTFAVEAGQDRTVYAVGGRNNTAVTAFVTTDVNTAPAAGQTRFRVVNVSPTAGAVDVFVTAPNADLAATTPSATNVAAQSVSGYLTLPAATYQVRAVPAGTPAAGRATAVSITLNGVAFAGGAVRTIVLADNNVGGAPLRAFVLADN
jgi:hypothetical protein